jgi:hypothetical protein
MWIVVGDGPIKDAHHQKKHLNFLAISLGGKWWQMWSEDYFLFGRGWSSQSLHEGEGSHFSATLVMWLYLFDWIPYKASNHLTITFMRWMVMEWENNAIYHISFGHSSISIYIKGEHQKQTHLWSNLGEESIFRLLFLGMPFNASFCTCYKQFEMPKKFNFLGSSKEI